ncbi:MAG: hypothetical protein NDI90_21585 [Nitrospira sp. BO4]|jgi:hypothetical protein|nr:hypothetical protein [Nitrospira sp. BO4]
MNIEVGTEDVIPLPSFTTSSSVAWFKGGAGFRRFGKCETDLAVDFSVPNRAALATRLLELCAVDSERLLPPRHFIELSIGKRIECLLLLAAGGWDKALSLVFKCQGCGEELELELTFEELSEVQREADKIETIGVDLEGRRIEFRKPTGRDQEVWARTVFPDEQNAAASMISSLAVTPDFQTALGTASVSEIERMFDDADPLVNFSCRVSCGECDRLNGYRVDLMETALAMLSRMQTQLIHAIHRMASHYHWSEADVLAVPEWRRQQYLQLIGATKK